MAYTDFTWKDLYTKYGIKNKIKPIFGIEVITPVQKSDWLKTSLEMAFELPLRSEKAKSEAIIMPILTALRKLNNNFFTIFSGENLNIDEPNGLKGECDFILAKDISSVEVSFPIMQIVEAKKHDLDVGIPQCVAQLVGAKLFNEQKQTLLPKIYGCVTTGNDWIFMFLENDTIFIDSKIYYLNEIENILGVFQKIIDYYKELLN